MSNNFLDKARQWLESPDGENLLTNEEYCPTRDIFQARLETLRVQFEQNNFQNSPLLIAIIGEIGNNSFDHNLGNWRNTPGIYMDADTSAVIIADRGQGVKKTISRVRPDVANDKEAIKIAFTEKISGRSPEQRGNGLKFVKGIVEKQKWKLHFLSGNGAAKTNDVGEFEFIENDENILGCVALISLN